MSCHKSFKMDVLRTEKNLFSFLRLPCEVCLFYCSWLCRDRLLLVQIGTTSHKPFQHNLASSLYNSVFNTLLGHIISLLPLVRFVLTPLCDIHHTVFLLCQSLQSLIFICFVELPQNQENIFYLSNTGSEVNIKVLQKYYAMPLVVC